MILDQYQQFSENRPKSKKLFINFTLSYTHSLSVHDSNTRHKQYTNYMQTKSAFPNFYFSNQYPYPTTVQNCPRSIFLTHSQSLSSFSSSFFSQSFAIFIFTSHTCKLTTGYHALSMFFQVSQTLKIAIRARRFHRGGVTLSSIVF